MPAAILAEYETPEALIEAVRHMRTEGHAHLDAYTPYPLVELEDAVGLKPSPVPRYVLIGGILGVFFAWFIQWYPSAVDYPLNVSGFNPNSLPSYVFISFELGILFGGLTAFLAVFALARLPRLWDPIDEVEGFERASVDRFFLLVARTDVESAERQLEATAPLRVVRMGARP
jgi:hypothetical protein